jgi:tetrahydromethanopterin S-methyltransferase subunit H
MSNLSKKQFEQLDMFKPAKELRGMHLSDVDVAMNNSYYAKDYNKTAKVVMARKVRQSKRKGLHESIEKEGVKTPVEIGQGYGPGVKVLDGHHRIASAMAIDPKMMIPVEHK